MGQNRFVAYHVSKPLLERHLAPLGRSLHQVRNRAVWLGPAKKRSNSL
jgi:hypothetical protein